MLTRRNFIGSSLATLGVALVPWIPGMERTPLVRQPIYLPPKKINLPYPADKIDWSKPWRIFEFRQECYPGFKNKVNVGIVRAKAYQCDSIIKGNPLECGVPVIELAFMGSYGPIWFVDGSLYRTDHSFPEEMIRIDASDYPSVKVSGVDRDVWFMDGLYVSDVFVSGVALPLSMENFPDGFFHDDKQVKVKGLYGQISKYEGKMNGRIEGFAVTTSYIAIDYSWQNGMPCNGSPFIFKAGA